MSSTYLTAPLIFLVQVGFDFYCILVALRFLLQYFRLDFFNPISQFIVKATGPVLYPLRRLLPGFKGLDIAALVLIWLLLTIKGFLIGVLSGMGVHALAAPGWAIPDMVALFLQIFMFAIIIRALMSWLNPDPRHPAAILLYGLTEPILKPFRKLGAVYAQVDFAPLLALITLYLLNMLLLPPLHWLFASPF